MTAACTLGVISVNRPTLERRDRILDKAGFVERVRVDSHLDIKTVRDRKALVNRRGRRAPVFVKLQPECAGPDLFF